ncbi:MAG: acidic tetraheme cytochrome c3 TmcA [Desulfobacterales bacterium]
MAVFRKKILLPVLACLFLTAAAVWAQGYITSVEDSAFDGQRTRPAVSFNHDEHNEAAGIESCNTCHHYYEDGKKLDDQDSIGMECSDCHYEGKNDRLELIRVYHLQCKNCHQEEKKGPVQCGQCHTRKTENSE